MMAKSEITVILKLDESKLIREIQAIHENLKQSFLDKMSIVELLQEVNKKLAKTA